MRMDELKLKVVMTGFGTVKNPDGTTQEFELRAERPLTDNERAQYEAHNGVEENGSNSISDR